MCDFPEFQQAPVGTVESRYVSTCFCVERCYCICTAAFCKWASILQATQIDLYTEVRYIEISL